MTGDDEVIGQDDAGISFPDRLVEEDWINRAERL